MSNKVICFFFTSLAQQFCSYWERHQGLDASSRVNIDNGGLLQ